MHNIKNKSKLKLLTILGAAIILALGAVMLSISTNTRTTAYASSLPGTFMRTRDGILTDLSGWTEGARLRTFASFDFQRNSANFRYWDSSSKGNLWDINGRHNRVLREQSIAIREAAQEGRIGGNLTVFVHGQGGRAADWSNCGGDGSTPETFRQLRHSRNSMIEDMRGRTNGNVYVARSYIYSLRYRTYFHNGTYYGDFFSRHHVYRSRNSILSVRGIHSSDTPRPTDRPLLSLFPLEACENISLEDSYIRVNDALRLPPRYQNTTDYIGTTNNPLRRTFLRDKHRHNILIFESNDSIQTRAFVYNELNALLTKISYDYLQTIGRVPAINFIGHSTGGVWSMMWANNHPHNVGAIFSMGAPFNGSETGRRIRTDWISAGIFQPMESLREMINNPASFDNTDYRQANILRAGWANAVAQNPQLRLYTMAGTGCINVFAAVGGAIGAAFALLVTPAVHAIAPTFGFYLATYFVSSLEQEGNRTILPDDFAVSRSSAHAEGFANPNGQIAARITRSFHTTGGTHNTALRAHPEQRAVPHNMLTKDYQVRNFVSNRFSRLIYTVSNNEVTITRLRGSGGSLTIPSHIDGLPVVRIGAEAFAFQNLGSINIPNSVRYIDDSAFIYNTNLWGVFFPNGSQLRTIGNHAFSHTALSRFTIPRAVTSIGSHAFAHASLESIEIPAGVATISDGTFYRNSSLRSVTFASMSSLQTIGTSAFQNTAIESIAIPPEVTSVGNAAFMNTALERIEIPAAVMSIGAWAFADSTNLQNVLFWGHNLQTINTGTFRNTAIQSITIPASVTSIGQEAFWGISALRNVTFAPNSNLHTIGNDAFRNSSLTSFTIPRHVTRLGLDIFTGTAVAVTWHYNPSISHPGVTGLPSCIRNKIRHVVVPDGIEVISDRAFFNLANLASVVIPNSVHTIGTDAFRNVTNLNSINIPASVHTIGSNAFHNTGIWNRAQNDSIVYIGNWVVGVKGSVAGSVTLLPNIIGIADSAFSNQYTLTNVVFPQGLRFIGNNAFSRCALVNVTIPSSVERIGNHAFSYNRASGHMPTLERIYVDRTANSQITQLGALAFGSLAFLRSTFRIIVPNCSVFEYRDAVNWNVYSCVIRDYAGSFFVTPYLFFMRYGEYYLVLRGDVSNARIIHIPARHNGRYVIGVAENGFQNAPITDVSFESGTRLRMIGANAFSGSHLERITIPSSVRYIGANAFSMTRIMDIILPESLTTIGDYAFSNIMRLRIVTVMRPSTGNSFTGTELGRSAFAGISAGSLIYFPCWISLDAYSEEYGWRYLPALTVWFRSNACAPWSLYSESETNHFVLNCCFDVSFSSFTERVKLAIYIRGERREAIFCAFDIHSSGEFNFGISVNFCGYHLSMSLHDLLGVWWNVHVKVYYAQLRTMQFPPPTPILNISAIGDQRLSEFALPEGWHWANPDAFAASGDRRHYVFFTHSNPRYYTIMRHMPIQVRQYTPSPEPLPDDLIAMMGDMLYTILLPARWSWVNPNTSIWVIAGFQGFLARYTPASLRYYSITRFVIVYVLPYMLTPIYTLPSNLTAYHEQHLSAISLLAGWSWVHYYRPVGDVGVQQHLARFTPLNLEKYRIVYRQLSVEVKYSLPPSDEYGWVWVFDMELGSPYNWAYVGDSIQLRIELRFESGWTEYIWVYLNAGESKYVFLSCCLPYFYIEFDGSYLGVTVHNGSWMFSSYFATVYRWVEPPV